jgi:hypothetical protein
LLSLNFWEGLEHASKYSKEKEEEKIKRFLDTVVCKKHVGKFLAQKHF